MELSEGDAERIRRALESHLFGDEMRISVIGAAVGVFTVPVVLYQLIHSTGLIVWTLAMITVVALSQLPVLYPRLRGSVDGRGIPTAAKVAAAAFGIVAGSLMWVDLDAMAVRENRFAVLLVLSTYAAGTVSGRAGVTGNGIWTLIPLAVTTVAGLLAAGDAVLATCVVFFGLSLLIGLRRTAGLLQEVIAVREKARIEAERATTALMHDPVTGLLNQHGVQSVGLEQDDGPVTAMFIDLNKFKHVNERFGHAAGDELLAEAADRIRSVVGDGDQVARLGGDEFLILTSRLLEPEQQDALARRLIEELDLVFEIQDQAIKVSASVGIAVADPGVAFHTLQRQADYALYLAKTAGPTQPVRFDGRIRDKLENDTQLAEEVRHAIDRDELVAWGQPIVNINEQSVVSVELLSRWVRPSGKIELPSVFIPIMIDAGQALDLTRRVVRESVDLIERWGDDPSTGTVSVAVNVSVRQLLDTAMVRQLWELVASRGIDPNQLVVEVTDLSALGDAPEAVKNLQRLAAFGIRLVLDDFGGRNFSLGPLMELPLQSVKLDRQFVWSVVDGEQSVSRLRSVVDLCRDFGIEAVAKGIERIEHQQILAEAGITVMQGHLYSEPKPLDELEQWIRSGAVRSVLADQKV